MKKTECCTALLALACTGMTSMAMADAAPMRDRLGINEFMHDNVVAQGYGAATGGGAVTANKDPGFMAGPLKITFGGFTEIAGIYRTRNETADVGSNFTQIPFANNNNFYVPEYRESARQSRFAFLVQGPSDGSNKVESYMETDFLSSGTTSNSNESNSYTLRLRQFYGLWKNDPYDFYVLGGQAWSLASPFKKGLIPRQENIPLTIDAQYVVGFNWARQAQIRFVKNFGSTAALGISLEEPQNVLKGTAPSGALGNNSGGSLLNSTTTYSTDIAPDVIVKLAVDPGFGHYEIYGLTRFLHDRGETVPGTKGSMANSTTVAGSFGASAIVPVIPKLLDLQVSGLVGRGNGRYGSGQLADSTYNPGDGSVSALQEQQMLVGLVAHPTRTVDAYLYAGMEHAKGAYSLNDLSLAAVSASGGKATDAADNTACNINTPAGEAAPTPGGFAPGAGNVAVASCSGNLGVERQISAGFWWKFYKGSLGYLMTGAQYSFTSNGTFTATNGSVGRTNDNMGFLSFRYYPFQ